MTRPFILSAAIADPELAVPETAATYLTAADEAGLDLLLFGEAGGRPFDAQVLVAWAAPRSQRVGLVATVPASNAHPFHVARALSAVDFLSAGRTGWSVIPEGAAEGTAEDMVGAARSLWDGWGSDTLILDKASGRYLDASKVKASNYEGPVFKVTGPVNAMRPLLGQPVLVLDDAAPIAIKDADIALVSEPTADAGATKSLLKVTLDTKVEDVAALFAEGKIEGVHMSLSDPLAELPKLAALFAELVAANPGGEGDLRARLGLPLPSTASNQPDGAKIPEIA
ncbi:LLM class flavin-dependent oxidoreductase [Novosphingobium mangrovi (ex Hu et al. 2023)]|uniref:LLM class flavin-dependent oxidoreductase n=1 Tax=Novosphingobium mangrovi (ex Hu et al. 2023) TaxID=2930094 RepID=A0ABT0AFC1_9SPHN|nr:LLM class flavin-dependent oxidoreductase [Novosphingobium mangrovi (ex Hu et al. 2023)]MCJ1961903.1 LLM class flavin-dependent oxidoreductase [Novosphingobium mangrovi (ex Hu et al. 2023)]